MSKVTAYRNTERHCFCHIRFDSGERILVSVAGLPRPGIRVIKLMFGFVPSRTLWEYDATTTDPEAGHRELTCLFTDQAGEKAVHPLDALIRRLLTCGSWYEAVDMLQSAGQESSRNTAASARQ